VSRAVQTNEDAGAFHEVLFRIAAGTVVDRTENLCFGTAKMPGFGRQDMLETENDGEANPFPI
jgi:hypothetical protein